MKLISFVLITTAIDQIIKVSVRATLPDWTYWKVGPVFYGRLDHAGSWLPFFIVVSLILLGYIILSKMCAIGHQPIAAKWFMRCAALAAVQWVTQSIDLGLLGYATNYLGVFCIAHLGDGSVILSGVIATLTTFSLIRKGLVSLFNGIHFDYSKAQPKCFAGHEKVA